MGRTIHCALHFSHGAIEVENSTNGHTFKVNGQRLKPFVESFDKNELIEELVDPMDES